MRVDNFSIYYAEDGKRFVKKDDYTVFGEQIVLTEDKSIEDYKQLTKTYHDKWLEEHENENSD